MKPRRLRLKTTGRHAFLRLGRASAVVLACIFVGLSCLLVVQRTRLVSWVSPAAPLAAALQDEENDFADDRDIVLDSTTDHAKAPAVDAAVPAEPVSDGKAGFEIFRHSSGRPRPICRFYGACMTAEGRLVLPRALKYYAPVFEASAKDGGCSLQENHAEAEYLRKPLYALEGDLAAPVVVHDREANVEYTTNQLSSGDLFSTQLFNQHEKTAPLHVPHFLYQIQPWFFVQDVLRRTAHPAYELNRSCYGDLCEQSGSELEPELFMSPDLMQLLPDSRQNASRPSLFSWITGFLGMMSNAGFVFREYPQAHQMTCHRSIVLHTNSMNSLPEGAMPPQSWFFKANDLSQVENNPDLLRITILQRNSNKRPFQDIDDVENIASSTELPAGWNAALVVGTVAFDDNVTLAEQIETMQMTDILITPHGAGLANTLFMQPGNVVVEVLPFGFCHGLDRFSWASGARHQLVFAKPDVEGVLNCVQDWIDRYGSKEGVMDEAEQVANTYNELVGVYRQNAGAARAEICGSPAMHQAVGGTTVGRRCVRDHQKIHVNANELGRVLRESARAVKSAREAARAT